MRAGRLRERIEIYKFDEIANEYGERERVERLIKSVWASIDSIKGDEKYINDKEISLLTHKVEIRYFKGLDESYFIKFKGCKFNIKSVINPYERDERMILMCIEQRREL